VFQLCCDAGVLVSTAADYGWYFFETFLGALFSLLRGFHRIIHHSLQALHSSRLSLQGKSCGMPLTMSMCIHVQMPLHSAEPSSWALGLTERAHSPNQG
jgi:hypothetical protein